MPSGEFGELALQGMTVMQSVGEAWPLLHHDNPSRFENAIFNYVGLLGPGLTIRAEIKREPVNVGIGFEAGGNRFMTYKNIQVNSHPVLHFRHPPSSMRVLSKI
jgi:hypothetical protein